MVGVSISNSIDIAGRKIPFSFLYIIEPFINRVENDNGVFESDVCLNRYLVKLNNFKIEIKLVDNFQERIFNNNGIIEAKDCLISDLENINQL